MVCLIEHGRYLLTIARSAAQSLLLHKMRSGLSILGIVCGVMTVLSIMAIGKGAERETLRRIELMGIKNIYVRADTLSEAATDRSRRYLSNGLQLSDLERLHNSGDFVKRSAAIRNRVVEVVGLPLHVNPQIVEATAGYRAVLGLPVSSGRFITRHDINSRNRVCVLGFSVSAALGPEGKPGKMLRIGPDVWKIIGVLGRKDSQTSEETRISLHNVNDTIVVPLGTLGPSGAPAATGTGALTELIVEVDSVERVQQAAALLERTLLVSHHGVDDFALIVPLELLAQSRKIQRVFSIVFGAVGGLTLMIGGIGIMNIMLAGISERIREIGLRRAVGARPYHIVVQFVTEAVLLTTVGGILGSGLGVGLALLIGDFAGWPVSFTPAIVAIPLGLAMLTGGFFGLYPALKASKMDPLRALGYLAS